MWIETSPQALVLLAVVGCSSPQNTASTVDRTAPQWFRGVWKLEWARAADGPPTQALIVRDVQTPTLYGSVRIPITRPAIAARSFDELTDVEIQALLDQQGFAGTSTFEGSIAVWAHDIDFQPRDRPDSARLTPKTPTTVYEETLDGAWRELWWNLAHGEARFLGVEEKRDGRVQRVFVVVGDHFLFARNRSRKLPRAIRSRRSPRGSRARKLSSCSIASCPTAVFTVAAYLGRSSTRRSRGARESPSTQLLHARVGSNT